MSWNITNYKAKTYKHQSRMNLSNPCSYNKYDMDLHESWNLNN